MDVFEIIVHFGTNVIPLGTCDKEHISVIRLLHAMKESHTGISDPPKEDYLVCVHLPWCSEKLEVNCDRDILRVFDLFEKHRLSRIVFEIEPKPYRPVPPEGSSSTPYENPDILLDSNNVLGWSDLEENLFDDVRDSGGNVEVGLDSSDEVDKGEEAAINHSDGGDLQLFEGYQSGNDDLLCSDSDDESPEVRMSRIMQCMPFKEMVGGKIDFQIGQTHDSVYSLREILREYAIQEGFNFQKIKNDKTRLTYRCKGEGCPWRLHASCMLDKVTMKIRTYVPKHECFRTYKNDGARVTWIASKFEALVKSNPEINIGVISYILRERYKVNVGVQRLYKAKKKALDSLGKDHTECFQHLRTYAYMVQQTNPRSIAYIHLQQPRTTFQRFMLSFAAQKEGFLAGCRPFIGLDGCHLKGPYKGILLSAVALDANNGLFPLAVCICEIESKRSWSWFLQHLHTYLEYPENEPITFMSDRQKGVLSGLETHWPNAKTRFCARHIYANFRTSYPGQQLKNLFWKASRAGTVYEFKTTMEEIGRVDEDAKKWLEKIDPKHWSRFAFDVSIKCDHVTNNMTESFNSMLGEHRAKTFLQLLEHIRRMVMKRFQQRKEECSEWPFEIPPIVNSKIIKATKESRLLTMLSAGNGEYELLGETRSYVAKLKEYTCECGLWQISGVPCSHAIAGISHYCRSTSMRDRMVEFVSPYLTKAAFLRTYDSMIHPVPDRCVWPTIETQELLPPTVKKLPGRPKVNRKRESNEKPKESRSVTVACGNCGVIGHNSRSCKNIASSSRKARKRNTKKSVAPKKRRIEEGSSSQPSQSQLTQK